MADSASAHVLLVSAVGVIGGAERVLCEGARAVKAAWPKARVSALLFADGPLRAALEALGISVRVVPMPARLASAGDSRLDQATGWGRLRAWCAMSLRLRAAKNYARTIQRAIGELRPTLVHAHGFKALFVLTRAISKDVALLWHVHDFVSGRPLASYLVRRVMRRVTRAIAVSDAVSRDLASVAPEVPVSVVRNGVDLERFSPAPRDGRGLDRLAGLASDAGDRVRVGLVATYAHWKGHEVFLRAIAGMAPGARGYVVGGPIYATVGSEVTRAGLQQLANGLGLADRVGFIPFQEDPADVYRMLDVVVHASTRPEPFGLTIVEAMACGRAVVVSAAGGALEFFDEGVTALGHTPGDVAGLARAIERLAGDADLRERLGRAARAAMEARFGRRRFAMELLAVYAMIEGGRS